MRLYLQSNQVAEVVQLIQDVTSIHVVCKRVCCVVSQHSLKSTEEIPGDGTSICFFVQGGTVGSRPEPYKMTSSRLLVYMFLNVVVSVLTALHRTA